MDGLNIRTAELSDLAEIQKLNIELFKLEYENYDSTIVLEWPLSKDGEEYFSDAIKNHIVIVACLSEKIIGYLVGSLNSQYSYNKTMQAELDNMCISSEFRGKGIGKKLFEEFKKICIQNGINEIKVVASYGNKDAINFYKSNGFEEAELTLKQIIK